MKIKYAIAFSDMAERFGQTSAAKRLKVGALIVKNDSIIALGINGMPPGWPTEHCEDDDNKTLPEVRHAELAALQKLWNSSETASGASMFVSHCPCMNCAIDLVTAGIKNVVFKHEFRSSEGMYHLLKYGVNVYRINDLNQIVKLNYNENTTFIEYILIHDKLIF
jgi:dCMP deaminase